MARPGAGVGGELAVPGDKSISHRALMLGAVAEGVTEIHGFLHGADCLATLAALRALGVLIDEAPRQPVVVHGVGRDGLQAPKRELDLGNAGTAMRLLAGLLAGQGFDSVLVGDDSLMRRPMQRVAQPLCRMGAAIRTDGGRPPLRIAGGRRLVGVSHELEVPSAQVKSALLLAGLYAHGTTQVVESAVTRDHTERMLRSFGADVRRDGASVSLRPGPLGGCRVDVPGDFSSAAFFVVAGVLAGRTPLLIRDVGVNPTRTGLLDALELMGARIELRNPRVWGDEPVADLLVERAAVRGISLPHALVPRTIDELPVLCIAAALAEGETVIGGAAELRLKESDRIAAMAEGLAALGVHVEPAPDGLRIRGGRLGQGTVDSRGDHRVAMSFAVAALRAGGPVRILDVANVETSFPGFAGAGGSIGLELAEEACA